MKPFIDLLSTPGANWSTGSYENFDAPNMRVPVQTSIHKGSRVEDTAALGKSLGAVRTLLKVWVCSLGAPSSESANVLVELSAGDRVWLRTTNFAHGVRGDLETTFAGHLLQSYNSIATSV